MFKCADDWCCNLWFSQCSGHLYYLARQSWGNPSILIGSSELVPCFGQCLTILSSYLSINNFWVMSRWQSHSPPHGSLLKMYRRFGYPPSVAELYSHFVGCKEQDSRCTNTCDHTIPSCTQIMAYRPFIIQLQMKTW